VNLVSYHQQFVAPYVRARWGGNDETGASLVEYALLVALIAVVCILAITFLGRSTSDKLSNLGSNIQN
jgi:pilus assembly protein Flp/PilA